MTEEKDRLAFIHDHLKNLGTLSSAAIVVLLTLAEKFSAEKIGMSIALVGFVFCLLSSLIAQAILLAHYPIGDIPDKPEYNGGAIDKSISITWVLFFGSMVALAYSAFKAINA